MSDRKRAMDVVEVLSRYVAGYFPLYDAKGRFYWERLAVRAVIPVDSQTAARARRMGRRGKAKFELRYTTAVEEVIGQLAREEVKENSWVKEEVREIYRMLHVAGILRTVEAWDRRARLVGGLLGIVVPGTFIAETMFGLEAEASKACLCRLVEDCHAAGFEMIDVQTPHDVDEWGLRRAREEVTAHPCVRLGERRVRIGVFMRAFVRAWKRSFDGGVEEWLASVRAVRAVEMTEVAGAAVAPENVAAARRLLGCG